MNTCDTCKHWHHLEPLTYKPIGTHKLCWHPKVDCPCGSDDDGLASNADYDYGVTTGPKFGCIHHEPI